MTRPTSHESDRIGAAIGAAAERVTAPDELRAKVRSARRPTGRRGTARALALAAALAMVLAVVVVVEGPEESPGVLDAANLALASPARPAPAVDWNDDRYLEAEIGGVRFPNYGYGRPSWRVVGARADNPSGQDALTLTYGRDGRRVGYTVVDGDSLEVPASARHVYVGGQRLAVLRHRGALVVTWERGGRTCVLAARDVPLRDLLALATWRG